MRVPFLDLLAQYNSIKGEIDSAIAGVIGSTAFIGGNPVKDFEAAFAAYCGGKHCVGVGNGTDAIAIALRAMGVGPGDEVITVANSFIATSEAVTQAGAQVVFVDCHPDTYTIDPDLVEAAITPRTKAIIPVHLYGRPADMDRLMAIAERHQLLVVEDSAQSHGAEINGRRIGTIGHAACFSFYPGKNLGAYGDGGAIVTNDDEIARVARMTANHGRIGKYDHEFEGVNSRLDGMQAAILSAKLPHLEKWIEMRRTAAGHYERRLAGRSGIVTPGAAEGLRHVYHLYVVRVVNREQVQERLSAKGISTGVHYPVALPNLTAYSHLGMKLSDIPVASRYSAEILSLPIYPEITPEQIDYVCDCLIEAVG